MSLIRGWCLALMAVLFGFAPGSYAADYSQGVDVAGDTATVWFKSNVNTTWVDLHYQVNGGGQQNVRMTSQGGRHVYPVRASNGQVLSYFFTYNNGNPAYDSPRHTYTVGTGTPPPPPPPPPPPSPDGPVCFYEHVDFRGARLCVGVGQANLAAHWARRISSVKLAAGHQVELFAGSDATGRSLSLDADATNLVARGFNDAAVSYRARSGGTDLPVGNGVMTLKLVNATGGTYPDAQVYWSVIGYHPETRVLSYVDRNGQLVPASLADNDAPNRLVKNGQNYANYFYKMSEANWVSLPRIDSGRMFISLGSPMYIKINQAADGRLGFAGPDLGNATDPNQDVYFEWIEFTLDRYGYHGNTTRVDQFGFPLRTRLLGKDGYDRTLGETESRAKIFADFEGQLPAEFRPLVQRPYRIVAPAKGNFNHDRPQARYFDAYVEEVWRHYRNNELVFTAEAGTFRGRVIGDDFVFSKDGGPANLYIRGKPSTQAILEGSGNLATGNPQELVLQAQITAAFNRHLLLSVDPSRWSDASAYYPQGPANFFAKFWHDHSLHGLAYGFCYDDVRGHSSLQEHADPKGLIVTVGW